jgi:Secretory pathway protein Sec39
LTFILELDIAKSLLRSKKSTLSLDDRAVEEICLTSSREFYDNASSGNYNFGDMKLAYDWYVECRRSPLPFRAHLAVPQLVHPGAIREGHS